VLTESSNSGQGLVFIPEPGARTSAPRSHV
jgi:hypothetical protein